jgi:hypothetical protein
MTWRKDHAEPTRGLRVGGGRGARGSHLVALNFAFGIILKVSVTLIPAFNNLAELVCECGIEEVVDTQTRARRFRRIGRAYTFLGSADAVVPVSYVRPVTGKKEKI